MNDPLLIVLGAIVLLAGAGWFCSVVAAAYRELQRSLEYARMNERYNDDRVFDGKVWRRRAYLKPNQFVVTLSLPTAVKGVLMFLGAMVIFFMIAGCSNAEEREVEFPIVGIEKKEKFSQRTFRFMEIIVKDGETGELLTEKFFLGRMAKPGEAVEMVYVDNGPDGSLRFQLRVKEESK